MLASRSVTRADISWEGELRSRLRASSVGFATTAAARISLPSMRERKRASFVSSISEAAASSAASCFAAASFAGSVIFDASCASTAARRASV